MCWSPNTPCLDPTRCQLEKNTPDLNRGIFDLDQVGGITSKVQGSGVAPVELVTAGEGPSQQVFYKIDEDSLKNLSKTAEDNLLCKL